MEHKLECACTECSGQIFIATYAGFFRERLVPLADRQVGPIYQTLPGIGVVAVFSGKTRIIGRRGQAKKVKKVKDRGFS
jgi:hypothetical protein